MNSEVPYNELPNLPRNKEIESVPILKSKQLANRKPKTILAISSNKGVLECIQNGKEKYFLNRPFIEVLTR